LKGAKVKDTEHRKLSIKIAATAISLLLYSFVLSAQSLQNESASIHFNRLNTADGLSNSNVYDLIQDHLGFLWFTTEDGLNRFDGYEFKIFRHEPKNENSISDNSIWAILEDSDYKIWIGTQRGGLNRFDPITGKFTNWKIKSDQTEENSITVIYEDRKNFIWIGTYKSGLYKFDQSSGKIENWQYIPGNYKSLSNNYVTSIAEDNKGNIWVGTYYGLNRFNPQSNENEFIRYYSDQNDFSTISNNLVWNLSKSKIDPNLIWIGTADGLTRLEIPKETAIEEKIIFSRVKISNPDNLQFGATAGSVLEEIIENNTILWIDSFAGLVRLNTNSGRIDRFISDKDDPNSISNNHIHGMIKDKSGVLWLATPNGISFYSSKGMKFNNILSGKNRIVNLKKLYKIDVTAMIQTSGDRIWIGTEKGLFNISKIESNSKTDDNIFEIKKVPSSENLNIWSLSQGNANVLWIGTYGSGLFRLDIAANRLEPVRFYNKKNILPSINYTKVVYCDSNCIWIGLWGPGLARFNSITGEYKIWYNDANDPNSLSYNDVWSIHKDKKGRIWIGTNGGGLNLFENINKGKFIRWTAEENKPGCLSSNSIYTIYESQIKNYSQDPDQTILWIGTNNGLNKFVINNSNEKEKLSVNISYYTTKDGLADNSIKSIIEDDDGNLWLGTSFGISLFNAEKNTFLNFDADDGIIGSDFNFSSALHYDDGTIFMGSSEGLNYFNPKEIVQSKYAPPIEVTDFQIFNKSVSIGENSLLKKGILYTKEIIIPYSQNVFSFQIAALDFNSPQSIQYKYIMEGFDNDWVNSQSRRFITYTNLNPGTYFFKVKSTNSDGIWNENIKTIKILITPPWWQTEWAILLYAVIFILGIWGIIKFQNNRTKLRAELRMREFESNHLREIESMKSRFFANLSHEFRTPLMLIKGPVEQLLHGRIKENITEYYKMLFRNTEKLQHLIDQLLELSQLESASIPLNLNKQNLVSLLRGFTNSFIQLAVQKNISLTFQSDEENIIASIDKDKFEKIINNLLNNAFKFTGNSGNISVRLSVEKELNIAVISISDTGIGIPNEYQSKIFNRFYQVDDSSKRTHYGSGIGLALVKELINLHKWDISFQSKEGEGTNFYIKIPIDKDYAVSAGTKDLLAETDGEKSEKELLQTTNDIHSIDYTDKMAKPVQQAEKSKILIVEDSQDVRKFISDLLKKDYETFEAEKAEEGIKLALKNMPELIISDIMMPGMDGIEFCKLIKNNWETSHIPVILLTAKISQDSKIEGLETGADDYITKPFSYDELSIRIKNLINQRKVLREKFSREINIEPGSISGNSLDKEFMGNVLKIIEENLHNEKFDSELLAKKMYISRSQLHRKLHAITGQGPGEFIRIYKLKRAAQKIFEKKLSITQIAYDIGFNSPAQFTRAFQKYFNCLPSEFNSKSNN
jgi:signal transduction histidine kinase/ligand-binding sensor domain-containing protein/DNA-binding response OmpR family regulator